MVEQRAADGAEESGRKIYGYAAVFNSFYPMYEGYAERILPGAFDGCDFSDVVCLFNHNEQKLLARSTNGEGTLKISVDEVGLRFEFEAANTTAGNDVLEDIRLKNIKGCSFAFYVKEDTYTRDVPQADGTTVTIRDVVKISKVCDVGPVVWPAYDDTEIECCKRSLSEASPVQGSSGNESQYLSNRNFLILN